MSAVWENTNVIQMLNVEIKLDPTAANVKRDFQEMAKGAQQFFKKAAPHSWCDTKMCLYMSPFFQPLHACSCAIYFIV